MDLQLSGRTIAVGGATSGLGKAIAQMCVAEGATVIGVARTQSTLDALSTELGDRFEGYAADLSDSTAITHLSEHLRQRQLYACVFNAGGPPTGLIADLDMNDWDAAYRSTLRWKIQLTSALAPGMTERGVGRLLYLESVSIKQPIDNLVLSNAMRAAVAGFVKTLSREIGQSGVTANILAPGYHATPRITTVLEKSAKLQGMDLAEVKRQFAAETATKELGAPTDFAATAAFLLSPNSRYITGQTVTVDGGLVRHIMG